MKILHLIPTWGNGGAERQLSQLAPAIAASGNDCHVAYCTGGPNLAAVEESRAVHLHQLATHNNHDPRIAMEITATIQRVKPDIVQTWLLQMDVMGGIAARITRTPHIISERSAGNNFRTGWKFRLRRLIAKRAQAIVANSRGGAEYWKGEKLSCPIFSVSNCLAKPMDYASSNPLPSNTPSRLLIFAGRLVAEKNIATIIEAARYFLPGLPEHHLYLFGAGPMHDALQRQIDASGLAERIRLCGHSTNLPAWFAHADAMISLSQFEGQPNAVLEAAQAGCPLILSDIPAHREVFSDEAAAYCQADNAHDVARVVCELVAQQAVTQARVGHAKQAVAGLSVEATVAQYLQIYQQVLSRAH